MSHKILISVGSNINKQKNTRSGLQSLYEQFTQMTLSTIYESESVGFEGNNFLNLVVQANTTLSISAVCARLKSIENEHGRVRDKKFGNRTLDLDLLTYDDVVCSEPITLPRGEIEYNAFVLQPMAELAPHDIHPVTGQSYADMWQNYTNENQRLWPSGMQWSPATT
ncbi:MAG: 2-amino-4-hydroxy-6-hydroxymethyldihydropteridine diphosphokinase [Glaciecola sp.]